MQIALRAPETVVGPVAEAQVGKGYCAPVQAPEQWHMVAQVPCESAQHRTASSSTCMRKMRARYCKVVLLPCKKVLSCCRGAS